MNAPPSMPGRFAPSSPFSFFSSLASSGLLLASLIGCDAPAAPVDAAMGDAYTLPMSRLLGACFEDRQCPGTGAFCRTADQGFPGGQCTNPCMDRTDCDDGAVYNDCLLRTGASARACEAYCRNGSDCRAGYTCQVTSAAGAPVTSGLCVAVCATDAECGGTSQCDAYTGRCVPHGMVGTAGALTGDACTGAAACRSGDCRLATENGTATGYVQGYCQSLCRLPAGYNTSNFFSGDTLPAAGCVGDAVCIPGGNALGLNDLGVCLRSCTSAGDCRAGYTCAQTQQGHTFTNGFCIPFDCATQACPAGSTCHQMADAQGRAFGRCG